MMKRLEEFLFYFLLVSLPFSIRHIFGYSPVGFMEWKAVSLYGTDILFLILLLVCFIGNSLKIENCLPGQGKLKIDDWLLVALIGISAFSTIHALDVTVAWYQTLKLAELVLFYWYVKYYAVKVFEREKICMALVAGGIFQAVVAILQFTLQHSLGLKYFGESVLSPSMTGIAAFISNGAKVIRAYGTTPHPNVLAGYLLLALAAYWLIWPLFKRNWLWQAVYAVMLWGLLATFSRTVIAIGAVLFLIWAIREFKKYRQLIILSCVVGGVFLAVYWPYVTNRLEISNTDEAVTLRVLYNHEALSHGISWFGVGAGNFVPWLMRQQLPTQSIGLPADQYQPVHNIYLLIYKEIGPAGLAVFFLWLILILRKLRQDNFIFYGFFVVLLLAGLFDHFLWTIQPGQLLFWLSAGLLSL